MGWKKVSDAPAVNLMRTLVRLQQKLAYLRVQKMTLRAKLQVHMERAPTTKIQETR